MHSPAHEEFERLMREAAKGNPCHPLNGGIAGHPPCTCGAWKPQFCSCPVVVDCNCAHIPPTMPTFRTEHLSTCPVARIVEILARRLPATDGVGCPE